MEDEFSSKQVEDDQLQETRRKARTRRRRKKKKDSDAVTNTGQDNVNSYVDRKIQGQQGVEPDPVASQQPSLQMEKEKEKEGCPTVKKKRGKTRVRKKKRLDVVFEDIEEVSKNDRPEGTGPQRRRSRLPLVNAEQTASIAALSVLENEMDRNVVHDVASMYILKCIHLALTNVASDSIKPQNPNPIYPTQGESPMEDGIKYAPFTSHAPLYANYGVNKQAQVHDLPVQHHGVRTVPPSFGLSAHPMTIVEPERYYNDFSTSEGLYLGEEQSCASEYGQEDATDSECLEMLVLDLAKALPNPDSERRKVFRSPNTSTSSLDSSADEEYTTTTTNFRPSSWSSFPTSPVSPGQEPSLIAGKDVLRGIYRRYDTERDARVSIAIQMAEEERSRRLQEILDNQYHEKRIRAKRVEWAIKATEAERKRQTRRARIYERRSNRNREQWKKWTIEQEEQERNRRIRRGAADDIVLAAQRRQERELVQKHLKLEEDTASLGSSSFDSEEEVEFEEDGYAAFTDDYEVVCPYTILGCGMTCLRSDLENHLDQCDFRAKSNDLDDYSRQEEYMSLYNPLDHVVSCPYQVAGCSHQCSRAMLPEHMVQCLYQNFGDGENGFYQHEDMFDFGSYEVVCPYATMGCTVTIRRSEISSHLAVCEFAPVSRQDEEDDRNRNKLLAIAEAEKERWRRVSLVSLGSKDTRHLRSEHYQRLVSALIEARLIRRGSGQDSSKDSSFKSTSIEANEEPSDESEGEALVPGSPLPRIQRKTSLGSEHRRSSSFTSVRSPVGERSDISVSSTATPQEFNMDSVYKNRESLINSKNAEWIIKAAEIEALRLQVEQKAKEKIQHDETSMKEITSQTRLRKCRSAPSSLFSQVPMHRMDRKCSDDAVLLDKSRNLSKCCFMPKQPIRMKLRTQSLAVPEAELSNFSMEHNTRLALDRGAISAYERRTMGRAGHAHTLHNHMDEQGRNLNRQLDQEILDFSEHCLEGIETYHKAIEQIRRCVQQVATQCFGYPVRLDVFGSFATGLAVPGHSDVDLVLSPCEDQGGINNALLCNILGRALRQHTWVTDIKVLDRAKMPVIKLETCNDARVLKVDITINSHVHAGLATVAFVNALCAHYSALRPLTLTLKRFLAVRGLSDPFTGGLGSYALVLMIVASLNRSIESGKSKSLAILLLDFLELYGKNFDSSEEAVVCVLMGAVTTPSSPSVRPKHTTRIGKRFHAQSVLANPDFAQSALLVVDDAIQLGNNVGATCFRFSDVQRSFADVFAKLLSYTVRCETLVRTEKASFFEQFLSV